MRITHAFPSIATRTSYSSPGPECTSTLVHASVRATEISLQHSSVTPNSPRALTHRCRTTGMLSSSRGRLRTRLISTKGLLPKRPQVYAPCRRRCCGTGWVSDGQRGDVGDHGAGVVVSLGVAQVDHI